MIFTVTLNPALDKTVTIPSFSVNAVNRVQSLRTDAGGKGINVSKCIGVLGGKSTALAILGGNVGKGILSFLEDQPCITPVAVWTDGETRTNMKIVDPDRGFYTDINEPGPKVGPDVLSRLRGELLSRVKKNDIVVLSGSMPAGAPASLYGEWCRLFREHGARVFLDADGDRLALGLDAKPDLIKPNRDELAALTGKALATEKDVFHAAVSLLEKGIARVVVSLGKDGALFLSRSGALRLPSLEVPVRSTVGAGDSMVAALAYGAEQNMPWEKQARLAVAFGTASVTCDGTQTPSAETVQGFFKQTKVKKVSL